MMHHTLRLFILLLFSGPLYADGFWDQGLNQGVIRSDYPNAQLGTASSPLSVGGECLFPPGNPLANGASNPTFNDQNNLRTCPENPAQRPPVYSNSNFFGLNGGETATKFWVTHFNLEDWFFSKNGPPSQSLPRSVPGFGVFGFTVIDGSLEGEEFLRAHLVLNTLWMDPDDNEGNAPIPFMSVGAEADRGNGGKVGTLNGHWTLGHMSRVTFTSRLWDASPDATIVYNHFVYFRTIWDDVPKMAFVALHWDPSDILSWEPCTGTGCTSLGPKSVWSWPIQESFFFPGADIGFTNVEVLADSCSGAVLGYNKPLKSIGEERTYKFNITRVFRCLSDVGAFETPMPTNSIPLLGVHWGSEAAATNLEDWFDGWLWTSVHGMIMSVF